MLNKVFSQTIQSVITQVDTAYKNFFKRRKAGKKGGYPRFKSRNRFHSIEFKQYGSSVKIDGRRLKVFGVGRIPVRFHRPIQGEIKVVRIIHKAGRWFVCFFCQVPEKPELPKTGKTIGLDMGISSLITTSDGDKIDHPYFYRDSQRKLRILQRSLARKEISSTRVVQKPRGFIRCGASLILKLSNRTFIITIWELHKRMAKWTQQSYCEKSGKTTGGR